MIKSIKKYKFVIIATLLFLLVIIYFRSKYKTEIPSQTITPTPIVEEFRLEHIFPPAGKQKMANLNIALQFKFSKPINLESAETELRPFLDTEYSTNEFGNTLYIIPKTQWVHNTQYEITLDIKSNDGKQLTAPVKHSFTFTPFTHSPLEENYNR